jgi:large subunit ribosomal protein L7Ae
MAKAKKVAAAPKAAAAAGKKKEGTPTSFVSKHPHLFSKAPRDYRVGRAIQPKRDLSRFVKWPRYVRLQRQRSILKKRLKVPPSIHQFARALDKNQASTVFKFLAHYRPESKDEKKKRLKEVAKTQVKDEKKSNDKKDEHKKQEHKGDKPLFIKYGLNHITTLVEEKKAKLVVIAHDVDPIELVLWLPALCRKKEVPYCIVKGKARLGQLVHKKTATAVAITEVKGSDAPKLEQIIQAVKPVYNDNAETSKKWGGGVMGIKAQHVIRKREKAAAREANKALHAK